MSPALLDAGGSMLNKIHSDYSLGCLVEVMKFTEADVSQVFDECAEYLP